MAFNDAITYSGPVAVGDEGSNNLMNAAFLQYGVYASMPAAGNAGVLYVSSNGKAADGGRPALYRDNGATWDYLGRLLDTAADLVIASEAQGDILYRGASAWERLAAGTSGYVLKTQGAGANPVWGASLLGAFAASDDLLISGDGEESTNATGYTMLKQIRVGEGVFRVKFDLKMEDATRIAYGRIYRNHEGTPAAVGTERSEATGNYQTFSEDLSGWQHGDYCELWVHSDFADKLSYVRNFRVYGAPESIFKSIT